MNLKKNLKSKRAQAVVEYIVIFTVLAAGIILVFGGFNPDNLSLRNVFRNATTRAINQINQGWN